MSLRTSLDIIVSVYNEESVLESFYKSLKEEIHSLSIRTKIIFVNDGSTDKSLQVLTNISKEDDSVVIINFSRNFGHESAMLAGLDHSDADAVICLDSDLQHPPSFIPKMWYAFQEGKEIVTMVRSSRDDGGALKKWTTRLFYSVINRISELKIDPNASDFFLISGRVAKVIREEYREQTRFLRGFIQMVGFDKTSIEYVAPKRFAGNSKYSIVDLLSLSLTAIASMTKAPLRIGIYLGLFNALLSLIIGVYSLIMFFLDKPFSGYTTIMIFLTLMFSMLFFVLGILGNYIGFIFDQTKDRPHYIVKEIIGQKIKNIDE